MNDPVSKRGKAWRPNTPAISFERLDDEVVALHMASGLYFNMEHASAEVWSGIEEGRSFEALLAQLLASYEVEPDRAEADLSAFIDQLLSEDLVGEKPAKESAAPVSAAKKLPYPALKLEKYRDLQYLLMVDPVHEVKEAGWPQTKKG